MGKELHGALKFFLYPDVDWYHRRNPRETLFYLVVVVFFAKSWKRCLWSKLGEKSIEREIISTTTRHVHKETFLSLLRSKLQRECFKIFIFGCFRLTFENDRTLIEIWPLFVGMPFDVPKTDVTIFCVVN